MSRETQRNLYYRSERLRKQRDKFKEAAKVLHDPHRDEVVHCLVGALFGVVSTLTVLAVLSGAVLT